jgi:hypothetical protein
MRTLTAIATSLILSLPAPVHAELMKFACNIHYRGLNDSYRITYDSDTGKVNSTNKHGINSTTQSRSLNPEIIVYDADSFYLFIIDLTTLKIRRNFEINGNYAGEGSCENK